MPAFRFVLVRPQHPGNIGAAARALANFSWSRLVLVDPQCPWPHPEALQRAVGGRLLVERAKSVATLDDALRGTHYVIGTSRRVGKHRQTFTALTDVTNIVAPLGARTQVAVLFGSEEHGLHSDEIARCQAILHIPTNRTVPSLNLAHAVALVAYEIRTCLSASKSAREIATPAGLAMTSQLRATVRDHEDLFTHWQEALAAIGYFPHGKPTQRMRVLRQLLDRTQLTSAEVQFLRGIARQMLWAQRPV